MATFRITEQEARVIERSYDIEGDDFEQAQEKFEALEGDERVEFFIHSEIVRSNVEIINVEDVSA